MLTGLRDTRPGPPPTDSPVGCQSASPLLKSSLAHWLQPHGGAQGPTGTTLGCPSILRSTKCPLLTRLLGSHLPTKNSNFTSPRNFRSCLLPSTSVPSVSYRPSTMFLSLCVTRRLSSVSWDGHVVTSTGSGMQVLNNHFLNE